MREIKLIYTNHIHNVVITGIICRNSMCLASIEKSGGLQAGVVVLILFGTCFAPLSLCSAHAEMSAVIFDGHPLPRVWNYENRLNYPAETLCVKLELEEWQALAAIALVPVFINRKNAIPIIFDDGTENRTLPIPHNTTTIRTFGNDAASAAAAIATKYWSRAEIVVVTDNYEHALLSVPVASFLTAPILVTPAPAVLQKLDTKCAIIVGNIGLDSVEVALRLDTKEALWNFQLELFDMKGQVCDYIVVTNPRDTVPDDNVKWKFLSLASAPLAAYRHALIQADNYTGERTKLAEIASATKKLSVTYDEVKPSFEKVKNATYAAARFLAEHGHEPKFLTLVGGSFEIPNYYFDWHLKYLYWGAKDDYPGSLSPYATITPTVNETGYERETLAVGRLAAHSLLDATLYLARIMEYRKYLSGWEKRALVIDGHRINQPDPGGPTNVSASEPYYPSKELAEIFSAAGYGNYSSIYQVPRNVTNPDDNNLSISELIAYGSNCSVMLLNVHGGSKAVRIELGVDTVTGKKFDYYLTPAELMHHKFAPTIVYSIACESGTIGPDYEMNDYLPLAYLHAGCVAYIAPDSLQELCYWEYAPSGTGVEKVLSFFRTLMNSNIPIGTALREAKWYAHELWRNDSRLEDDVDGVNFMLYGDPAFEPYKPNVPFIDKKRFDLTAVYAPFIDAGSDIDVTTIITELGTSYTVNDALVTIKFQSQSVNGYRATFTAPAKKGAYRLEIVVRKEGYSDCVAKYWLFVPESKAEFILLLTTVIAIPVAVFVAIIVFKKLMHRAKKTSRKKEMLPPLRQRRGNKE